MFAEKSFSVVQFVFILVFTSAVFDIVVLGLLLLLPISQGVQQTTRSQKIATDDCVK